ncbi:MAG: hypothetical protein H6822_03375 [Planctomycetaceae bacterium]|nr:hypothetical protein [Planctomycetales bacterium]MCB9921195.1 hypothetical protein [Planctomycetaceae bacterium]
MKRLFFAYSVLILTMTSVTAQENQFNFTGYSDFEAAFASQRSVIEEQQEQISQLQTRLASLESYGLESLKSGKGPAVCDDWCHPCAGVNFMGEIVWLRAGDSDADSPDNGFQSGSRYQLGYTNNNGRGVRLRYFEYRNPDVTGQGIFDYQCWDAEYSGRFQLGCNWTGELAGGVRFATLQEEVGLGYDESWGPVISALVRTGSWRNLTGYGLIRESYVVGIEDFGEYGGFAISEIQLGLEWNKETQFGKTFVRGMLEGQHLDAPVEFGEETVTLVGFGLAAGITR